MAVSPADFELYSRVTGRAVPRSPQERMKMAPAVNKFIKNREYERPQQTTLQKGADLLGKAALIGGALAAGHAIGGGFRGTTAEKVAEVVGNMAKTGDVGEKGGKVVKNVAKASTGMAPLSNEVYGALQQEEILNNLAQDTVLPAKPEGSAQIVNVRDKTDDFLSKLLPAPVRPDVIAEQEVNAFGVPTPKGGRDKVWGLLNEAEKQKQAENIYGDLLTKEQRMPLHRQYSTIQSDQKQPDYPAEGSTQEAVDNFLRDRYYQATEESLRGIPGESSSSVVSMKKGTPGWRVPPSTPINEATKQLQAPFPPVQPLPLNDRRIEDGGGDLAPIAPDEGGFRGKYVRDDQLATTSKPNIQQKVGGFLSGQRYIGANVLDTISRQGGGRDLRQSAPGLVAAITGRGLVPHTGGGLLKGSGTGFGRNVVGGFWDAAGNFVRRDPIVDGAVRGLEGLGNMNVFGHSVADAAGSAFNAVPGLSDAVNLGGVKLAELGLLGGGVVLDSAVKDTLKLGVDARRFAENRFGFRPLSWQETAVQTGNLLDQGWSRDEAAKVAARNNPLLAEGMSRHDEAISSLQRNIQAALSTTVPTGQVAIGENAQLNRHPDLPPGETDMAPSRLIQQDEPAIAPARLIQQFSDKGLLGEGSLTPDDLEIRTDVDVRDPVNFTQLFGKRMGRGEKAKFVAGLQDRNKDIYSGASDLPKRKEGTGFKWEDGKRGTGGSAGEAATLSGAINYTSPDDRPKNPLQAGFDALREGYQEASAAEEVGRRMAEREEQGNLFKDDDDDPWFS